ncbi:MAG: PP2C family protein-serine/threonine phosphatase [Arachnia sp.]
MTVPLSPEADPRSHYVRSPAAWVSGGSDVGLKHTTNQDAMCLAVKPGDAAMAVLAVADGVSTTAGAEVASMVAAESACRTLSAGVEAAEDPGPLFESAFEAAHAAIIAAHPDTEPSACTLITGIVAPNRLWVASVGDSRGYWLGDDGACELLSTDDSMAQARIMLGIPRAEAEQSSHSITKWLGRDATNVVPEVTRFDPPGGGWLLLCSDGLWNYASSPEQMAALLDSCLQRTASPEELVEALVTWAKAEGGHDNITVVVARVQG